MADQIIVVNPEQQQRQQLIEDMKRLKASPLNRSIPGGYFLDPGGETAHDANGNPIPLRSEKAIKAEVAEAVKAEAEPEPATPANVDPSKIGGTKGKAAKAGKGK